MRLLELLPQKLNFYGVGELEKADPSAPGDLQMPELLDGIAVHIIPDDDDEEFWLLMLFSKVQDNSCFEEAANLLAATAANQIKAWISPPVHMTGPRLVEFIGSGKVVSQCNYAIRVHQDEYRLKTLFLSSVQEAQHDV